MIVAVRAVSKNLSCRALLPRCLDIMIDNTYIDGHGAAVRSSLNDV